MSPSATERSESHSFPRLIIKLLFLLAVVSSLSGCRFFSGTEPTRTPIPTFTPTPILVVVPAGAVSTSPEPPQQQETQREPAPEQVAIDTPVPPTRSPTPKPTLTPTLTPEPTSTPTPAPTSTAIPDYQFELETALKFPTESLAPDVVRIFLYVYAPGAFGLADYGMRIVHNGALLDTDALSTSGLPESTRQEPSQYTRFTNLNAIIVEPQAGEWTVQLVDREGNPVGPPAEFALTADEATRELYVRYRLGSE